MSSLTQLKLLLEVRKRMKVRLQKLLTARKKRIILRLNPFKEVSAKKQIMISLNKFLIISQMNLRKNISVSDATRSKKRKNLNWSPLSLKIKLGSAKERLNRRLMVKKRLKMAEPKNYREKMPITKLRMTCTKKPRRSNQKRY